MRLALVSWATRTSSSSELIVCSGCSSIRARRAAPRRPSSSRARARMRLMRVNAVSDRASTDRHREEHGDDGDEEPVGQRHRKPPRLPARANRPSSSRSRRCMRSASPGSAWSYSSRCSTPWTTSSASSSSSGPPRASAWRARHGRADHDVAEHQRRFAGLGGRAGPRPPWSGWRPAGVQLLVEREGEHVGGAVPVEEAAVEVGDGRLVDEDQRRARPRRRCVPRAARAGRGRPSG